MHFHRTHWLGALAFSVLVIAAVGTALAVAKPSLGDGGGLNTLLSGRAEQGNATNILDPNATSPERGNAGGTAPAPAPTAPPVATSAPARVTTPPPPVTFWVADYRPNWIGFIDASRSITIVRPDG